MATLSTCPTCGSIDQDSNNIVVGEKEITCPCKEQKEKAMLYRKERANIPHEYWYLGIEEYQGDARALKEVQDYISFLDNYYKKNIGLLLCGPNGVGKTLLAVAILKAAIKKGYKNVRFTCLSDIVSHFAAAWYSDDEQKDFYSKMLESHFLVIDDVGKEYKTKNNLAESVFDKVLRYREHPVIITSNKAVDKIEGVYGESIASLMYGKLIAVRFAGADFRKEEISKRLKEEGKKESEVLFIK